MKYLHFLFCSFLSIVSFAQDSIAIRYASSITASELKMHVYTLAGEQMQGRETGQPGQKLAAQYLISQFDLLQIPPIVDNYVQQFPLPSNKPCSAFVQVNGEQIPINQMLTLGGFQPQSLLFNEFVFAGYGIDHPIINDYQKLNVKGKLVVMMEGEPMLNGYSILDPSARNTGWSGDPMLKIEAAGQYGAKAVIMICDDFAAVKKKYAQLMSLPTNYYRAIFNPNNIPYVFVSASAAKSLLKDAKFSSFESLVQMMDQEKRSIHFTHKQKVYLDFPADPPVLMGENILGYIEGTDLRDELVVITAHYDHLGIHDGNVYYGADDDASGTAALLEIAQAFMLAKQQGFGPRRSILIMPVSGEEMGLLGSEYYVQNPIIPLNKTVANLNIDMIGRMDPAHPNDSNYVYIIGSDKLSTQLHQLNERANSAYTQLFLDYTYNSPNDPNQFYYRSDHYNFGKNNIPCIFYFTGVHKDYHKPTDTPDKLHYGKIAHISKLIFHTAWQLANQTERIQVDKINEFRNKR